MNTEEALNHILSSSPGGKWYNISEDERECTHLRVMAMRIKNGTAKPHTVRQFFAKFGYNQNEVTWSRLGEK